MFCPTDTGSQRQGPATAAEAQTAAAAGLQAPVEGADTASDIASVILLSATPNAPLPPPASTTSITPTPQALLREKLLDALPPPHEAHETIAAIRAIDDGQDGSRLLDGLFQMGMPDDPVLQSIERIVSTTTEPLNTDALLEALSHVNRDALTSYRGSSEIDVWYIDPEKAQRLLGSPAPAKDLVLAMILACNITAHTQDDCAEYAADLLQTGNYARGHLLGLTPPLPNPAPFALVEVDGIDILGELCSVGRGNEQHAQEAYKRLHDALSPLIQVLINTVRDAQ
jgi:hypothetical protein